jgi:hypothetical protein
MAFACLRIMQFIRHFPVHLHQIIFSGQHRAFVDDLHIGISVPGEEIELFHQLKTSRQLGWGVGNLRRDFQMQAKELEKGDLSFRLYLIVAKADVYSRMKESMPRELRKIATVRFFPWFGSINLQCIHHQEFKEAAQHLCAFHDTDKIQAVVGYICAAWMMSEKKSIPLSHIVNRVRASGQAYLKSTIPMVLRDQAVNILTAIPGFQFEVRHGYFSWSYSNTDQGQIPHLIDSVEFRNIEEEIITQQPSKFDDLEAIIS